MKKKTTSLICLVLLTFTLQAQKMSLHRAIKYYNAHDLIRAEKEITNAVQPPFSSKEEWAKATSSYIMIKTDLRGTTVALPDNLHEITNILSVYSQCLKADENGAYASIARKKINTIAQNLLELSYPEYNEKHFDAYLTIMDFYVLLTETLGETHGEQYAYIAKASTKAGHFTRAIYYWHKMININYMADHAYKEMLSLLYSMNNYDEVDNMLNEAKNAFPNSMLFAEVEILRLMDRDLMFKAKKLAEATVDKNPTDLNVVFLLGLINSKFKDHDEALESFLQVAHNNDEHYETHLELGKYFWTTRNEEGHLSLARHYLEKAELINPNDDAVLGLLR